MGRLVLVLIVLAFSGIVYLAKAGASKVTGKENVNFKDESKKMMEKTARGVQWMNDQWERAKNNAKSSSTQLTSGDDIKQKSANDIIARINNNPDKYDSGDIDTLFIDLAVYKMENRQFDDAEKLIMQLPGGEARDSMLNEITQKRKL